MAKVLIYKVKKLHLKKKDFPNPLSNIYKSGLRQEGLKRNK